MPTKRNRAGNQQNYVPKGNGDASGEYGDNASGSNKHFRVFTQPSSPKLREKQKKKFIYNEFYKKWDAISDDEYNKYEKLKERGILRDLKLKEEDVELLTDEEKEQVKKDVVSKVENEINNANIDNIRNYLNEYNNVYSDAIKEALNKYELSEDSKNYSLSRFEKEKIFPSDIAKQMEDKAKEKALSLSKEYIEDNFSKIEGEHTIEEDLRNVNPHYREGGYYTINCQRCSFAYELRRRGYDVEAYPNKNDFGRGTWLTQMEFKEKYSFSNKMGAKKLALSIMNKVKENEGSRWCVDVQWRGRRAGHLFIVENVNGNVRFFDAQNGNEDAITYLNSVATTKETIIYRMDNADFNYGVKETGFSPKRR